MHEPMTNCAKPTSCPNRCSRGANPHNPGFHRPHVRHSRSLTPTRFLHEGQTTDPHFCRNMN
jgi:hypothetical protein